MPVQPRPLIKEKIQKRSANIDGLNKREYFAIRILEGLISQNAYGTDYAFYTIKAVDIADRLIEELNKKED